MFAETFLLVLHFSYTVLFHRKKTKKVPKISVKHVTENLFLLFVVIAREHVGTQGNLTREHVRHVSTIARKERWQVSI